jgi:hypothetical protein
VARERFPDLTLEVLEQVYTRVATASYRYESAGGAFGRELTVNAEGFVLGSSKWPSVSFVNLIRSFQLMTYRMDRCAKMISAQSYRF